MFGVCSSKWPGFGHWRQRLQLAPSRRSSCSGLNIPRKTPKRSPKPGEAQGEQTQAHPKAAAPR